MTVKSYAFGFLAVYILVVVFSTGCSNGRNPSDNAVMPSDNSVVRQAMDFYPASTVFGDISTRGSDVDIASVVWGGSTVAGDIVVFDDNTSWDVAVAIVDDPNDYQHPAVPMLQFLRDDGVMVGDQIIVPFVSAQVTYARLPKIDCTYRANGDLEVVVAFRTGQDAFTWQSMQTWDVRVIKMAFEYTYSSSGMTREPTIRHGTARTRLRAGRDGGRSTAGLSVSMLASWPGSENIRTDMSDLHIRAFSLKGAATGRVSGPSWAGGA